VNFAGRPLQAQGASVQVAVKKVWNARAVIEATTSLGGVKQETFTVSQGVGACGVADGSVCTVGIPATSARFDSLDLKAVKGAFSVVGATSSLVSEVDKALACDDPTLTQGNATVTYLGNSDGECGQFGVTLTAGDEEIRFLKPLDVDPEAQFIFDVTWRQDAEGPAGAVPTVTIDFENYAPGAATIISDLAFCPAALYDAEGDLEGVTEVTDLDSLADWRTDLHGTQFACLDQPRAVEISGDALTVTDKVFLIGDAKMRLG
jgi:hypothetical protein